MNTTPEHLSASRIKTYLQCPLKYRLNYIDNVPWAFKPAALVLGTSIHAAVEAYYRARMDGTTLSPVDMKDVIDQAWEAGSSTDIPLDAKDPGAVRSQGHDLIDVFAENVAPRMILGVETDFRVSLADPVTGDVVVDAHTNEVLDIDLVGRMDLIETDESVTGPSGSVGTPVIVDLKTLARKPSETDLLYDLQLSAYAFAARRTDLVPDDRDVLLRFDVLTKTKRPSFSQHFAIRSPDSDRRFVFLACEIIHAIRSSVFPPNPGWQCGSCTVAHACEFMTNGRSHQLVPGVVEAGEG
ncbi:PD-(D/E)XK nuclease family protein [bacterium]|nr:PD-(D/E)XK nuclease family protein [bacterium]